MRVLVTGAAGMLGVDLCTELTARGKEMIPADRSLLDITDTAAVRRMLTDLRPDAVLHCAAWTNVDGAERDPDGAFRTNALGAWNVAAACAETGAWMAYISTDFVFDGEKASPYTEFDAIHPLNAYGASKEAGERLVRQTLPDRHLILRTSWLFGPHGRNFVRTIQRLAGEKAEVPVVADQVGCPTHTADLARKTLELIDDPLPGTYHVCGAGACSWYEFAGEIVRQSGLKGAVIPISAAEYAARFGSPTRRPAYSALRRLALEMRGRDDLPDWRQALASYLAR